MSEHRASFEKGNVDAEPVDLGRRLAFLREKPWSREKDTLNNKGTEEVHRSSDDGMGAEESRRNTGDRSTWDRKEPTATPRGAEPGVVEVGKAHSSEETSNDRGAKGPEFQGSARSSDREGSDASLAPPNKLWELQETLHAKAKGNPNYRFHALYDKISRADVLAEAWRCCQANRGAAGVDQESFEQIEAQGVVRWLGQLAQELQEKQYEPSAVRRVMIPKANGKQRPLGIPTIKDRVVQMAVVLVIGPIFEADLLDEQYAYRKNRNAQEAVKAVHGWLQRGKREVVDADLSGYFDTIPHPELIKSLARRISDGTLLALIKKWLQMPVEESDGRGGKKRHHTARESKRGTPQGAPISPLLSNLYMRRFILGWKRLGYEKRLKARIVNYADDFVILCENTGEKAYAAMKRLMKVLKLTVNPEKTRLCRVPEESFDFLGYTLGRCYSKQTGKAYIGTQPKKQKIQAIMEKIRDQTKSATVGQETKDKVQEINSLLRGWGNYFCLGSVSKAYRAVDTQARYRLRQWLSRKHQNGGSGTGKYPDQYLYEKLGLVCLSRTTRNFPWANA